MAGEQRGSSGYFFERVKRGAWALLYLAMAALSISVAFVAVVLGLFALGLSFNYVRDISYEGKALIGLAFGSAPAIFGLNILLEKLRYPLPSFRKELRGFEIECNREKKGPADRPMP